jgi:hypothetical protein
MKIVFFVVAAVAVFLVLKFVFSIAMSVLKWGVIAAVAAFVVWMFLGGGKKGKSDSA